MSDQNTQQNGTRSGGVVRELRTRKMSGRPSWPIVLIAGREKAGKTTMAADATNSPLVGRGLWVSGGEDDPEEYSAENGYPNLDGVIHDGTYRGMLEALTIAAEQPPVVVNGVAKPNLIVLDSGSRLWALLSDMAQEEADRRWMRKDRNRGKDVPDGGIQITMDLWNTATARWTAILDVLRKHQGPSIITARMEQVAVVKNGEPTGQKTDKVQAQKNLRFDVGAIVELLAVDEAYLTGVRSLRMRRKPEDSQRVPGFTVDGLWREMGLADGPAGDRVHVKLDAAASVDGMEALDTDRAPLLEAILAAAAQLQITPASIVNRWQQLHGHDIRQTSDLGSLELLRDDLQARAIAKQAEATKAAQDQQGDGERVAQNGAAVG